MFLLCYCKFDIFLASESNLDYSFLDSQFPIPGYRIVKKVRNKNGGEYSSALIKTYLEVLESKQLAENLEILMLEIILDMMNILQSQAPIRFQYDTRKKNIK